MADPGSVAGSWMMVDVGALTGSTMHTLYKTPFLELMADAAGSDARIKARGVSAMMAQGDEMRQELRRVAAGVPGGRGMTQVQTSVGDFSKMDVTGMTWANNEVCVPLLFVEFVVAVYRKRVWREACLFQRGVKRGAVVAMIARVQRLRY